MLIACSKQKGSGPEPARDLYRSPLFRKSKSVAERLGAPYYILSAKHGLVRPENVLAPYDVNLKDLPEASRAEWAHRVADEISRAVPSDARELCFLTGSAYSRELSHILSARGYRTSNLLDGLSLGARLARLSAVEKVLDRRAGIASLYDLLEELGKRNGIIPFADFPTLKKLPAQGVYFFFDPSEPTDFSKALSRLVRIGTHAVSRGSVASLRQRLRAHYGLADGGGNHRASIFRLHVGRALLRRDGMQDALPSWGRGESAEADVRAREAEHERKTSAYLRRLHLTFLEVFDEASPTSMRSYIERNAIALLSEDGVAPDSATPEWLGHYADREQISGSGLWNVRHVGDTPDGRFLSKLDKLVAQKQLL